MNSHDYSVGDTVVVMVPDANHDLPKQPTRGKVIALPYEDVADIRVDTTRVVRFCTDDIRRPD